MYVCLLAANSVINRFTGCSGCWFGFGVVLFFFPFPSLSVEEKTWKIWAVLKAISTLTPAPLNSLQLGVGYSCVLVSSKCCSLLMNKYCRISQLLSMLQGRREHIQSVRSVQRIFRPWKRGNVVSSSNFLHSCTGLQHKWICWLCCSVADELEWEGLKQPLDTLLHSWVLSFVGKHWVFFQLCLVSLI